jgi:DNA-binding response OmpR family regulator
VNDRSTEFGVAALASGLTVFLEGDDLASIMPAIRQGNLLVVQWERVGQAAQVGERLAREARSCSPDVWVLAMQAQAALVRTAAIRHGGGPIPILVASRGNAREEAQVLRAGADSYCRLPDEACNLAVRIHALLRRASGTFRVAARSRVELLHDDQLLQVDDRQLRLSSVEFSVVRRLDASRNRFVAPADLWALIAPSGHQYDSSLLRTRLLRIRKKLGTARWVLRTERGKGIMLTDAEPALP